MTFGLLSVVIILIGVANQGECRIKRDKKKIILAKKVVTPTSEEVPSLPLSDDLERKTAQQLDVLGSVLHTMHERSYRSSRSSTYHDNFIYAGIEQIVSKCGPHDCFLPEERYEELLNTTKGEFSGIGVKIKPKETDEALLELVEVIPQGPAHKAGLKAHDKVVSVNEEKLKGLSVDAAIEKFRGPVGSIVNLKVMRDKKLLSFAVKRDFIQETTSSCYYFPDQSVYYIALSSFNEVAAEQVSSVLDRIDERKCHGIILDLRRNPGGTLDSAIQIAELFLPNGSLVALTRNNKQKIVAEYKTAKEPKFKKSLPIFVLVDNFTASAAEILAGCLQYYSENAKGASQSMVFLVGTSTFGKGSVQEVIPVGHGCAIKTTTMMYFLPGDRSIQVEGIAPDLLVQPKIIPTEEIKLVHELYGKESALKNHITRDEVFGVKKAAAGDTQANKAKQESILDRLYKMIKSSDDADTSPKPTQDDVASTVSLEEQMQEALASDHQVQACVNMISMLHMAKKADSAAVATREKALTYLKRHYLTDGKASIQKIQ